MRQARAVPAGALPPEAARWLAVDLGERPVSVVVAGVTGGCGATTVAALVSRTIAAHRPALRSRPAVSLIDHDGGTLHERTGAPVPAPGQAHRVEPADVVIQCLGAHALSPQGTALDDPWSLAVLVAPWNRDGLRLGEAAADRRGADRTVQIGRAHV